MNTKDVLSLDKKTPTQSPSSLTPEITMEEVIKQAGKLRENFLNIQEKMRDQLYVGIAGTDDKDNKVFVRTTVNNAHQIMSIEIDPGVYTLERFKDVLVSLLINSVNDAMRALDDDMRNKMKTLYDASEST